MLSSESKLVTFLRRLPAADIAESSTIGAGDTFIAGMLYTLLVHENWLLPQKLAFANQLAGCKVAQEGFAGVAEVMQKKWKRDDHDRGRAGKQ